jgi:hypothetical protein
MGCPPVAVAITGFEANLIDGGVELYGTFSTDSEQVRVNVYRGDDRVMIEPIRYKTIELRDVEEFSFFDGDVEPGRTYRYHVGVVDKDGETLSLTKEVTIPVAQTVLGQNEPNPFNPTTSIHYTLSGQQRVTLSIYDASGRLVRTLVDGIKGHGPHQAEWNGTDNVGNPVGSGVYFYRLQAGKFNESRKMLLLK